MRSQIGFAAWFTLACAATALAAPCETPEACLQAVAAVQRETRTFTARFEQTKYLSLLNEPLVTSGRFAFQQPGEVLWVLDEPPVTVRVDQAGVHVPDLPAAAHVDLAPFGAVLRELSGIFTGSWERVQRHFEVRVQPGAEMVRVALVPRNPAWQQMFKSMEISFTQPSLLLAAIRLDENLGDRVEIRFSDVHRNDAVAAAAFTAAGQGR
jgi:outer membrane lipoprotein-sorting protein